MDLVVREAEVAQTAHEAIGSSFVMLILSAAVAFAQAEPTSTHCPHPLFSDAIPMTKAGLSDAPIVTHVSARRGASRFDRCGREHGRGRGQNDANPS